MTKPARSARRLPADPGWYRRAVFYEVLVRSFADSNADGVGDFVGLTARLDYLHWLGVDCLWLPPFYSSPLRDGGYDISDFHTVLPEFGTVEDFVALVDAAHALGMRVITDLVMNHTSDQHPWFVASRADPTGPYGDFYVWADDDTGYPDARIIFVDTEASNWTLDPVRGQYFWHRFFSHQPDLNYRNPAVGDAMIEVMRFWLDLGIDGFRLDAVPYLYEADGTDGENLPETHAFLRRCRAMVDAEYPDAVLLAEANQWPADVVEYFGDPESGHGESHMCLHFPLMPRLFLALARHDRTAISTILAVTPAIPPTAAWGIFLRNHDELTLEMVSEDEREFLWRTYAPQPRMRANIGIRRRLAPLLDGDQRRVRLLTALLLCLPGSPVLYYGDEIGMGDTIELDDRDGVRTPMQWSPEPGGGFSTADPGSFTLPIIEGEPYGFRQVNVADQRADPQSLLHFVRTLLEVRREHPVLTKGAWTDLGGDNPAILALLRTDAADPDGPTMLCLANLSPEMQTATVGLPGFPNCAATPIAGTGDLTTPSALNNSPAPGSASVQLPGYGFEWIVLESTRGQ